MTSSYRARGDGGPLPNPSLEIKEKAGGWLVMGGFEAGDRDGEGLTKASVLTGLGWGQATRSAPPFG